MRRWVCWGLLLGLILVLFASPAVLASDHSAPASDYSSTSTEPGTTTDAHGDSSARLWDLFWRAMNFLVVVLVLFFVLRKPLPAMLANRRKAIKEELEHLEAQKEEAQAQLDEAAARLKTIEAEKEKILQDFVAQGETEKARILAEADAAAARIKEQTRMSIDYEVEKARSELQEEVAEASATKALDLLKSKITPADRDRLVDEYLNKVVD